MTVAQLSENVRLVRAPNPSIYTLDGTNTYIVGRRDPIVIDPGPNDAEHLERVLDEAGTPSIVLLTHRHPDHAEGAEKFAALARAPLAAFGSAPAGACSPAVVQNGQRITTAGVTLRALHTPGHASDHLCFVLEEERGVFTGDHVLGRGTTVIVHPDGELAAYLSSLERLRAEQPARLYPGHGPVIEDPSSVIAYYIEHRMQRERQVLEALRDGLHTVDDIVGRVYADTDPALHAAAALSVRAHLHKLGDEGIVREEGGRWIGS